MLLECGRHGLRARRLEVYAAMIAELRQAGLGDAYAPIVTVHGEVLHNGRHDNISCPAICCSRMSGGRCRRDGRRTSRAPGP